MFFCYFSLELGWGRILFFEDLQSVALFFFFFFAELYRHEGSQFPQPGMEPMPPAWDALHLNHWITSVVHFFKVGCKTQKLN